VVQVNTVSALDVALQAGDVKETVTVVADAPALQTESSDVGTVVSTKQIQDLPLSLSASSQSFLQSPESFVFLTPDVLGTTHEHHLCNDYVGPLDSSRGFFSHRGRSEGRSCCNQAFTLTTLPRAASRQVLGVFGILPR
jgi:hypothetical protein